VNIKRTVLGVVVALVATTATLLAAPTAANAGQVNISCGPNIDPGSQASGNYTKDSLPLPDGTTVELRSGWDANANRQVKWARILNGSASSSFGIEWSDDHGGTWHYCWDGPNNGFPYTFAIDQWGDRWFRIQDTVNNRNYYGTGWLT
jgi:hypothetical protein